MADQKTLFLKGQTGNLLCPEIGTGQEMANSYKQIFQGKEKVKGLYLGSYEGAIPFIYPLLTETSRCSVWIRGDVCQDLAL